MPFCKSYQNFGPITLSLCNCNFVEVRYANYNTMKLLLFTERIQSVLKGNICFDVQGVCTESRRISPDDSLTQVMSYSISKGNCKLITPMLYNTD